MQDLVSIPRQLLTQTVAALASAQHGAFSERTLPESGLSLVDTLGGYMSAPPQSDWHVLAVQVLEKDGPRDYFLTFESQADADVAYLAALETPELMCATVARMTENRTDWM